MTKPSPRLSSPLPNYVIASGARYGVRKETRCRGKLELGCIPCGKQRRSSALAAALPGKVRSRGTDPSPLSWVSETPGSNVTLNRFAVHIMSIVFSVFAPNLSYFSLSRPHHCPGYRHSR